MWRGDDKILLDDEKRIRKAVQNMREFIYLSLGAWLVCFLFIFLILLYGVREGLSFSVSIAFELSSIVFGSIFIISVMSYLYVKSVYNMSSNPLVKKSVDSIVLSRDKILGIEASRIVLILVWKCKIDKNALVSVIFLCKKDESKLLKICKRTRIKQEQFDLLMAHIEKISTENKDVNIVIKNLQNPNLCKAEQHAYRMRIGITLLGVFILACGICLPTFSIGISIALYFATVIPIILLIEMWENRRIVALIKQILFPKSQKSKES